MSGRNIAIQLAGLSQQCKASRQPPKAEEIRYVLKETERWFTEKLCPLPMETCASFLLDKDDETWMVLWEASLLASNLYFSQSMGVCEVDALRPAASRCMCLLLEVLRRTEAASGSSYFKAGA